MFSIYLYLSVLLCLMLLSLPGVIAQNQPLKSEFPP